MSEFELLTALEVGRLLKCSRSQVYKLHSTGMLPSPVQLFPGSRGARWLKADVIDYILRVHAGKTELMPRPFVPVSVKSAVNARAPGH